jgi:hypothetical protein
MHIYHWDLRAADLWWAALALFGCLAMTVLEATAFRLFLGKW